MVSASFSPGIIKSSRHGCCRKYVFVGCGSNTSNLNDWWEYNINNDTWTQKPDLPGNTRHHPFYFSIDDFAYVGFGHGSSTGPGSNPSTGVYIFNDFYRYNLLQVVGHN